MHNSIKLILMAAAAENELISADEARLNTN